MDLYVGDFVISKHWCWKNNTTFEDGLYILEIVFKKSKMGKYGEKLYKEYKVSGKCVRCGNIIDIDDDYKKIDKDVGRFIKCLLEQ